MITKPTRGQIVKERVIEALVIGLIVGVCNAGITSWQAIPKLQDAVITLQAGQDRIVKAVTGLQDQILNIYRERGNWRSDAVGDSRK